MKKFFLSIVAALLAVPALAQLSSGGFSVSQSNLYYGVRLGMNIATVTGDFVDVNRKAGLTLGGVIGLKLSDSTPIFLESGLYFAQRGGKKDDVTVTASYLEIPILLKYGIEMNDNISLLPFIGPYFSLGVGGSYKYVDLLGDIQKEGVYKNLLRRPDMGIKVGLGFEYNMIYLEGGYQFGIANVAKDNPQDLTAHTGNVFLNLGVNF